MAFEDLGDWAELTGLKLPIGGKVYALPPVNAQLGIRIVALLELGTDLAYSRQANAKDAELLSDADERDLYEQILGSAYAEMMDDDVPWAALKHAAVTAMIDVAYGRERAEAFWSRLGKPTPPKKAAKKPADRQPRKATAKRTSTASTAGTTRSRAAKKAAPARRGPRSSPSGG